VTGGPGVGAVLYAILEQTFFTFFSLALLNLGRDHFNFAPHKFVERLVGASYFVYLFHPFVVLPLAVGVGRIAGVHPIGWMFILTLISVPVTWGIGMLVKLIPKIDYVL
jgi:peptidoglycan/LPS O-acetylase OafA/YrhL